MQTPTHLALFFSVLLTALPNARAQGELEFSIQALTVDANEGIAVADFNQDGKLDIAAGRNWYAAPDFVARSLRNIDDWNGYVESNGDFACDVNGDGRIDVIAGSFLPTAVYWYENPGPDKLALGLQWPKHLLVDTGYSANEGTLMHDIDGDGRPEWITNSWNKNNPTIIWRLATTTSGDGSEAQESVQLIAHVIGENANGHGMGFGDINNDGREDVMVGTGWYERPAAGPFSSAWTFHADWVLPASVPCIIRDVDGDGINDILWAKGHDYGLFWWQGQGPNEQGKLQWKEHLIDKSYSQAHCLHMADLDGDGALELITGKRVRAHNGRDPGGTEQACLYYYKWIQAQLRFERHTIAEGLVGTGLQIRTADLDGNGKLDIAVAGKSGTYLLFQK